MVHDGLETFQVLRQCGLIDTVIKQLLGFGLSTKAIDDGDGNLMSCEKF